jgi:hypothetical protein
VTINYDRLPEHMREGARRYIEKGIKGGSFMTAVFSNDFMGAYRKADDDNTAAMREWAMFLHNDAPRGCYGSPQHVKDWVAQGGLSGLEAA